jgi:3-oxoacyl-[acyl-carrier-protein] synthase-3
MTDSFEAVQMQVLTLLQQVLERFGDGKAFASGETAVFADILDSMAMVEFVGLLADSCGVSSTRIEACVDRKFTTVADLARSLAASGLIPNGKPAREASSRAWRAAGTKRNEPSGASTVWLTGTSVRLPQAIETAASIDARLERPYGWLERHAGIRQRCVWSDEDPFDAIATAVRSCLEQTGARMKDIGGLVVTSEAPPILIGLAAAVHGRLGLPSSAVALEIGGACTGFLAALWLTQSLIARMDMVLVVAIEAASRYLKVEPGEAGEAASLFGDGVAAALLTGGPVDRRSIRVTDVLLGRDGSVGGVLKVERAPSGGVEIRMKRIELAGRAIDAMAQSALEMAGRHQLAATDLAAVVAHGGNGRMPALLARRLGIPPERIWSTTATTGNLGSASVPVAWATHFSTLSAPTIWTAAGGGLTWGAALLESPSQGVEASK